MMTSLMTSPSNPSHDLVAVGLQECATKHVQSWASAILERLCEATEEGEAGGAESAEPLYSVLSVASMWGTCSGRPTRSHHSGPPPTRSRHSPPPSSR